MNFFEQQELARRNSRRLIVLFVLAIVAIVIAVNVAATLLYQFFVLPTAARGIGAQLPHGFYFTNTIVVVGLILGGTWLEMSRLRAGGSAVAQRVGARAVDPSTRDALDRRLLNVVEEMAIASGVPVPRVFVMDNEATINAFAAGHSIDDAVVTVTRGTLTRLNRDELQGVVAHEFSHILNGDMKLNLRLIGVLYGLLIVALAGRFLLEIGGRSRGGSDRSSGGAIMVLFAAGLLLWLLGYIGVFFGRLIKAGVSRQREYLADASAVQFTRNPDGIGGALRKIAGLSLESGLGSRIDHPQAESLSHLFLGAARPNFARGLFATHPPMEERLRRIYGRAMEALPAPENPVALALGDLQATPSQRAASLPTRQTDTAAIERLPASSSPVAGLVHAGSTAAAGVALAVADRLTEDIGTVRTRQSDFALDTAQQALLQALRRSAADGTRAQLLVLALLVDKERDAARAAARADCRSLWGRSGTDRRRRIRADPAVAARRPAATCRRRDACAAPPAARDARCVAAHRAPAGGRGRACHRARVPALQHPQAPARPGSEPTGRREVRFVAAAGVRSRPGVVAGSCGPTAGTRGACFQRRSAAAARHRSGLRASGCGAPRRRVGGAYPTQRACAARQAAADQGCDRGRVRRRRDELAGGEHVAHDLRCARCAAAAASSAGGSGLDRAYR